MRTGRVTSGEYLRWVSIEEDLTETDRRLFCQPVALAALGAYVIRIQRDSFMKWRRGHAVDPKPVVITIRHAVKPVGGGGGGGGGTGVGGFEADADAGWVTVMGLPVLTAEGEDTTTNFLDAFTTAAEAAGAQFMADAFDSATMILAARDLRPFLLQLDPGLAK